MTEKNKTELSELANKFHAALEQTNELAKKHCNHNPKRIVIMMAQYGAVETAKMLMAGNPSTSGYLIAAVCGRLDITIEATMLRPEFAPLFTETELHEAKNRLPVELVRSITGE